MSIFDVTPVTVEDYRRRAKRKLPQFLFDYAEGAANSEITTAHNESDFDRYLLKQRVLRDVSHVDTATTLCGDAASMPLALAPVGMAGMYARRGEVQGARAAQQAGIPFTTSTVGICSVEEVQAAVNRPIWFQLYMLRDREFVKEMLSRAQKAGSKTLLFTVDLPMPGLRLRDYRNGMLGGGLKGAVSKLGQLIASPSWAYDVGVQGKPHNFGNLSHKVANPNDLNEYKRFIDSQFDASVTWDDIHWVRENWQGKVLLKGIMEVEDARAAVKVGVDGIVVSNHGGRQLDGIASSISKLPAIAEAVGGQMEILLDGGIRSGIDVLKAMALGANGVLMGRPWIYALAARGEQGVVDLLDVLQREMAVAMALMGVNGIKEISSDHIETHSGLLPS